MISSMKFRWPCPMCGRENETWPGERTVQLEYCDDAGDGGCGEGPFVVSWEVRSTSVRKVEGIDYQSPTLKAAGFYEPIKPHPSITRDRVELSLQHTASHPGFCLACGEDADGCEPDAEHYECEMCGANAVCGAEVALTLVNFYALQPPRPVAPSVVRRR